MDIERNTREKHAKKERTTWYFPSIGNELDIVENDKVAKTDPEENKRRRAIILKKQNMTDSWGFTIQSYGIHHKSQKEIELLTYVDYVEFASPAYLSGMRPGDVILSINGISMENETHQALVDFIKTCSDTMRMVVLFENCCKKVDLHLRYLKLKRVLTEKIFELRSLEAQEGRILSGQSRFNSRRSSPSNSSVSSLDSSWEERLSLRPELDYCPTPMLVHRGARPKTGTASFNNSPRLKSRLHLERSSLPVKGRPYLQTLNPALRGSYGSARATRPVSMPAKHMTMAKGEESKLGVNKESGNDLRRLHSWADGEIKDSPQYRSDPNLQRVIRVEIEDMEPEVFKKERSKPLRSISDIILADKCDSYCEELETDKLEAAVGDSKRVPPPQTLDLPSPDSGVFPGKTLDLPSPGSVIFSDIQALSPKEPFSLSSTSICSMELDSFSTYADSPIEPEFVNEKDEVSHL